MARPTLKLIEALRSAAKQIGNKSNYNWKDIGSCNCGNVAQILTGYDKKEITKFGIKKHGDWDMLSRLYRKDSGYEIDQVIFLMLDAGMILDDFTHLENLSDKRVLNRIGENVYMKRDRREDVILYLNTWAQMLEEELVNSVDIKQVHQMLVPAEKEAEKVKELTE
ncbi:MAG: hypothetical protein ACK40G_02100 [Cytophagaceae bacterium]